MTNTSHSFGMTFSLSFRWSVSNERSFAYAQDDKGKEFGRIFLFFVIPRNDSDEESYPNKQ